MKSKTNISIPKGMDLNTDTKHLKLEKALLELAEFRYNELTRFPEIKTPHHEEFKDWRRVNDYILNSLVRDLKVNGIKFASKNRVADLIESNFSPVVNPIQDYFTSLPKVNGDPIGKLASTVKLSRWFEAGEVPKLDFRKYLEKWLVGAVANVFILDRCANQLCLIISGPQGCFKSSWIRNLCPEKLEPYYVEGSLDPDNKDSIIATATNFIFNLDDYFAGITSRKINEFKGLITKNTVKIRNAYARYTEELPKICSFIASSNEGQFLHDPTGNRRFLPFEVRSIDIDMAQSINMDEVWSQAYQKYQSGNFVYWMTQEEQQELGLYNYRFEVQSIESESLLTWFIPPNEGETPDADLTNTEILGFLQDKTNMKLSPKKLGQALRKLGFPRYQKRRNGSRSWVYGIVYADEADLNIGRQPTAPVLTFSQN